MLDDKKRLLLEERMRSSSTFGKSPPSIVNKTISPPKDSSKSNPISSHNVELNKKSTGNEISSNFPLESQESATVVVADSSSVELFNSNSNSNSITTQIEAWKNQVASYRLQDEQPMIQTTLVKYTEVAECDENFDNDNRSPKFQKTATGKLEAPKKDNMESPPPVGK